MICKYRDRGGFDQPSDRNCTSTAAILGRADGGSRNTKKSQVGRKPGSAQPYLLTVYVGGHMYCMWNFLLHCVWGIHEPVYVQGRLLPALGLNFRLNLQRSRWPARKMQCHFIAA